MSTIIDGLGARERVEQSRRYATAIDSELRSHHEGVSEQELLNTVAREEQVLPEQLRYMLILGVNEGRIVADPNSGLLRSRVA